MPIFFLGLGAIVGAIIGIFVNVGTTIAAVLAQVWPVLLAVIRPIWDALKFAGIVVRDLGLAAWNFGKSIYLGVLRPLALLFARAIQRIRDFLKAVFGPVFSVLDWINDKLDFIFDRILSPFFNIVDRIRFGLRILDRLGLDIAGVIERFLFDIEQGVFEAFERVRGFINNLRTWLNYLIDPFGFIQMDLFGWSWARVAGPTLAYLINFGNAVGQNPARNLQSKTSAPIPGKVQISLFQSRSLTRLEPIQLAVRRFQQRSLLG